MRTGWLSQPFAATIRCLKSKKRSSWVEREVPEERRRLAITSLEPQVDQLRESTDNTSLCLFYWMKKKLKASHTYIHMYILLILPMTMTDGTATHVHTHKIVCCVYYYYYSKALIFNKGSSYIAVGASHLSGSQLPEPLGSCSNGTCSSLAIL